MITRNAIVEIFEDPKTRKKKEGNARVIAHVREFEPGVNQYLVNFVGDERSITVTRTIADQPKCTCLEYAGDDVNCHEHAKVVNHV
jgi:hypothetical protein